MRTVLVGGGAADGIDHGIARLLDLETLLNGD
jgi:hypothetical protein